MKLFVLVVFIATSSLVLVKAYNEKIHYDSMMKSIYDKYGTAGIFITVAELSQGDMRILTIGYDACKMLSREGIPSIMVDFNQFKERLPFYIRGIVRPLVVIPFETMEEVSVFEKMATGGTMAYPIWLILFLGQADQDMCQYCRKPYGNLLNLRFDSQVFVLCCESDIIEEWWSSTAKRTSRKKIGRWVNEDRRIEWITNETLYSRRDSLEGRELRVAVVKNSAYIFKNGGKYLGFYGEILQELSQTMNFTISKLIEEDGYGSWDSEQSVWTGVIGKLERNEVDIGVSPFCMTDERLDVVDFTLPLGVGESRLYMRKLDGARVQWKAYFKAFAMDVWMAIIGLILTMPLVLTLFIYKGHNHSLSLVIEHYSCIWGIYCQQGLSKFPKKTSLRIVYVSIFISAWVIASVYSASLVSFLTAFSSYSPFDTLEEFSRDNNYEFVVVKDSSQYSTYMNSNETFRTRMKLRMKPEESLPHNTVEGFRQVCNDRVAFETNEATTKTVAHLIFCSTTSIATGTIETFGMITPRQSEYLAFINYRIRQFKHNGMFKRLENKYFKENLRNELGYPKVRMEGIEPILYTFSGGFIITLIIFVIEILFNWFRIILCKWKIRRMIEKEIKYSRYSRKTKNFTISSI